MQILFHLGLGKCASTYIQRALAEAREPLLRQGVHFPVEGGRPDAYGLARHYGFMPDAAGVTPRDVAWLKAEAESQGCDRLIISSEYFARLRPAGIARVAGDLAALDAETRFLFFSREVTGWVRSLFNQHVKRVDRGPYFPTINEYIDHALKNGAVDIAGIFRAWADAVGEDRIAHHYIAADQPLESVLSPFSEFAGLRLAPAAGDKLNPSLAPGALYLTGLVRQAPPSPGRNRVLGRIAAGDCSWVPVPPDYLEIDAERRARLEELVVAPHAALPRADLPVNTVA